MRSAVSASSCSRRARRMRASRDHWRPGNWLGSAMGTEVVLLDGGGEVLDFLRGDVGEGERLDGAGGAGLRIRDGAAFLEGAGEGEAGSDRNGLGLDGEGGDALQEVPATDESGAFGRVAVVGADLLGDRGEGRPAAFRAALGADVALEIALHQGGEIFEQGARWLLQAVGGAGEELLGVVGAFDREVDSHGITSRGGPGAGALGRRG